ncbi:MAG: amino acid ABC transporter permease, partial [Deltaproteobacteria bacterium]|nr:amino acid ABC transporter permease [Deltaproteobacteria bacterium]
MSVSSPSEPLRPPSTRLGVWGWMRVNLFNGWFNSLLTVVTLTGLAWVVPPFVRWAFWDALWNAPADACRVGGGACWSVITKNLRFIIFGFYPHPEQWRPAVAMGLLVALLWYSKDRRRWKKTLGWIWLVALVGMGVLMRGGILGLEP